jgi:hypothetical protein
MSTPLKVAAFALGMVAVFGAALGAGAAVGPVGTAAVDRPAHGMSGDMATGHDEAAGEHDAGHPPAGLEVTEDGYTLALADDALPAGAATPVAFQILGPDGRPVTAYDRSHDEALHLIAVRRDLSGFQHVHPALGADGVWRVPLTLAPGTWRLFADFVPTADGENRVLGADLAVAGNYSPTPLPAASTTAQVDGYTVTLAGALRPGEESELTLSISRDGRPVTDLQPYLSAYGHLVVLRQGDLAYLHVHPTGEPGDGITRSGPDVPFRTTAPSAGTYRLFLDFRHGDVVRTAEFTLSTAQEATR